MSKVYINREPVKRPSIRYVSFKGENTLIFERSLAVTGSIHFYVSEDVHTYTYLTPQEAIELGSALVELGKQIKV